MWTHIDFWGFLAGLGLFLFGMYLIEQGLHGLSSRSLKSFLRRHTRSPVRGVVTGTLVTAVLQSSSLVGLIVLAFVGAGILELRSAVGVILGANLGTTLKGWVVATIGFKLNLDSFAEPLLALGALGMVFLARDRRPWHYSNLLLGIGLLLMGMNEMKGGFEELALQADTSVMRGHHPLTYLLVGALFTAVIQSSSTTMMIMLSALHAGVIGLPAAAAVVIGADLGTTSTILLGAIQGSVEKRRVAMSHFLFNVFTDSIAFLMLPLLLGAIHRLAAIHDPLYALVAFHSSFNLVGIVLFLPLVNRFVLLLQRVIPDAPRQPACEYIHRVPAQITDAAIEAVRQDLRVLLLRVIDLNLARLGLPPHAAAGDTYSRGHDSAYLPLKQRIGEMLAYTYAVQIAASDADDAREITHLNHAVRNAGYAAKFIKDVLHNLGEFSEAEKPAIRTADANLRALARDVYQDIFRLLQEPQSRAASQSLPDVQAELRGRYEEGIARIYQAAGSESLDGIETSSLLNSNRAVYLSGMALLEAIRGLVGEEGAN